MPEITVTLAIAAEEYLRHYRGGARDVVATSPEGRTLRFPASVLRRVVTRDGVHGRFVIRYSDEGRFLDITRA